MKENKFGKGKPCVILSAYCGKCNGCKCEEKASSLSELRFYNLLYCYDSQLCKNQQICEP